MALIEVLRWLHVIGAAVLLGTGAGIAFFMVMAHRTGDSKIIAHVTQTVVAADYLFTATAAVAQPITGIALARQTGWPLSEGWMAASIGLYVLIGVFWLPVVWIQTQICRIATCAAYSGLELGPDYHRLFRIWFLCGVPAFTAMLAIFWLMVARPHFQLF